MLVAPPGRQLSKTLGYILSECSHQTIVSALDELIDIGKTALIEEGLDSVRLEITASLDLCYRPGLYPECPLSDGRDVHYLYRPGLGLHGR